jgi:hypothetical protein
MSDDDATTTLLLLPEYQWLRSGLDQATRWLDDPHAAAACAATEAALRDAPAGTWTGPGGDPVVRLIPVPLTQAQVTAIETAATWFSIEPPDTRPDMVAAVRLLAAAAAEDELVEGLLAMGAGHPTGGYLDTEELAVFVAYLQELGQDLPRRG